MAGANYVFICELELLNLGNNLHGPGVCKAKVAFGLSSAGALRQADGRHCLARDITIIRAALLGSLKSGTF